VSSFASSNEPTSELLKLYSVEQLSEYHLKLSRLIERIEHATTHFETLGIDPSASYDDVMHAFYKALSILYPVQMIRNSVPYQTVDQMDKAFSKASSAFSTLANAHGRKKYQRQLTLNAKNPLNGKAEVAAPSTSYTSKVQSIQRNATTAVYRQSKPKAETVAKVSTQQEMPAAKPSSQVEMNRAPESPSPAAPLPTPAKDRHHSASSDQPLVVNTGSELTRVYSEFPEESKDGNRRRNQRIKMSLPTRVSGYDSSKNKWDEMTQTVDVSRTGVSLRLRKRLRCGNVVYLTLPLPSKLRMHGFSDASFNSYAIVRRVDPLQNGQRVVAFEFIGEHPPKGYVEKPWIIFKPQQWSGLERRRIERLNRMEKVVVEYFDDNFHSLAKEETVTENVSHMGMRLYVKYAPFEFDLIRVSCVNRQFESLALVRNRYVGKEGLERLCIQFLNPQT
jgi:hypothetical protein